MANLKDTLVLGKLTATDSIIANKFIKVNGVNTDLLLANGDLLARSELQNKLIISETQSTSDYPFITGLSFGTNSQGKATLEITRQSLSDLKLSNVYRYMGTKTWAQLKQIASARVGDVYSISDQDGEGNLGADWACYQTVTAATGDNYATYWASLGVKLDTRKLVTTDTTQDISGAKTFTTTLSIDGRASANRVNTSTALPGVGLKILDLRSVTPSGGMFGNQQANFYFDEITDNWYNNAGSLVEEGTRWASILHMTGWNDNQSYYSWELAGNAHNNSMQDTLRYRQGQGTSWGDWQSVLTDANATRYLNAIYINADGDTMTGDLIFSGAAGRNIYYKNGDTRTSEVISFWPGDQHGSGVVVGGGGLTIVGAGESARDLRKAIVDDAPAASKRTHGSEELYLASDGAIYFCSNCDAIANRIITTYDASGNWTMPKSLTLQSGGNLTLTKGNATLTEGNLTLTKGNLALTQGSITLDGANTSVTAPKFIGDLEFTNATWIKGGTIFCDATAHSDQWNFTIDDSTYKHCCWQVVSDQLLINKVSNAALLQCIGNDDYRVKIPQGKLDIAAVKFEYNTGDKCIDILFN